MSAPAGSRSWRARVVPFAVAALLALGLSTLITRLCETDGAIRTASARFVRSVRAGEIDAAHAQMTSARRVRMTPAALDRLTDHPALRSHARADIGQVEAWGDLGSDEACVDVALVVHGEDWFLQLYLRSEDDAWRVESFALQPPATVQLGTLLPECGYWEGTTMGYHGPAIERRTSPVRPVD